MTNPALTTQYNTIGVLSRTLAISLKPKESISLLLETATDGGYTWSFTQADPEVAEVTLEFNRPDHATSPPLAGDQSIGTHVGTICTIIPLKKGTTQVNLAHGRSWLIDGVNGILDTESYTIHLTVI